MNARGADPAFLSHEIDDALVATAQGAQWLAGKLEEYAWAGYLIEGIMAVAAPAKYAVGLVIDQFAGAAVEYAVTKATERAASVGNGETRAAGIGTGVGFLAAVPLMAGSTRPIQSFISNIRTAASSALVVARRAVAAAHLRFVAQPRGRTSADTPPGPQRGSLFSGNWVEAIPRTNERQTADFLINGVEWELKTVSIRATGNGVKDSANISRAIATRATNATGQSPNVVIDASGQQGMTQLIAQRAFGRAWNGGSDSLQTIRIIGPDFDITQSRRR